MAEEFQGGVCGDTWWNPNQFYGGSGGFSTPCSVATQIGGGYDMGNIGWSQDIMKDMLNNNNNNSNNINQVCDDYNSVAFSANFDSTFDIMGFGLSPTSSTTIWNQQNQSCNIGTNEDKFNPMIEDINLSTTMINSYNFPHQDGSSPITMTTSSNTTSGDNSSTTTYEDGFTTSFPINSTASYLIQTLFNDDVDDHQSQLLNTNDYYGGEFMDNTAFIRTLLTPSFMGLELPQSEKARAPSSNVKSLKSSSYPTKLKELEHEEVKQETKKNMKNNNDQPIAKRPRIETPSPLPTFKVRKEKLGDRITALQQLVSPFGKTDTASVLQEAIEYIKFLHDQVHVSVKRNDNETFKQDLRSRGLCIMPITSTYPVTQETSVDFWTPTFG